MTITNMKTLQGMVKKGVKISKIKEGYYAEQVETNGDVFRLTQTTNLDMMYEVLKGYGLIK